MQGLPKINNVQFKLFCRLPAQRLCMYLANALRLNPKIKSALQDAITPYNKDDWGQEDLPALSVYFKNTKHIDNTWMYSGNIYLKFHIPLSVARNREQDVGAILTEGVATLLQSYPFFASILAVVPGLRTLGWKIDSDFSQLNGIVTKDVFTLPMTIDFSIDKWVWQDYINNTVGAEATNPCVEVYKTLESFELFVYPSIFPVPS